MNVAERLKQVFEVFDKVAELACDVYYRCDEKSWRSTPLGRRLRLQVLSSRLYPLALTPSSISLMYKMVMQSVLSVWNGRTANRACCKPYGVSPLRLTPHLTQVRDQNT